MLFKKKVLFKGLFEASENLRRARGDCAYPLLVFQKLPDVMMVGLFFEGRGVAFYAPDPGWHRVQDCNLSLAASTSIYRAAGGAARDCSSFGAIQDWLKFWERSTQWPPLSALHNWASYEAPVVITGVSEAAQICAWSFQYKICYFGRKAYLFFPGSFTCAINIMQNVMGIPPPRISSCIWNSGPGPPITLQFSFYSQRLCDFLP